MNNIVWLSPFWTAVFGLALITFIIAFNWNNIQKAVKERIGDQSLKDFLSTNLWVVIPRIIIALGAYIYVANMCGFFAIILLLKYYNRPLMNSVIASRSK